MLNPYELMWLWYYYHSEKVDLLVGEVVSKYDENCKIPITVESRRISDDNVKKLRKIMNNICGGYSGELIKYKNTFSHYKNKRIFEEYEYLNSRGEFDFIHNYVNEQLKSQRKSKDDYVIFFKD